MNENSIEAQNQYERADKEFRQDYDFLKQTASDERTRINELHEQNLDQALDIAKKETRERLMKLWKEKPLNVNRLTF